MFWGVVVGQCIAGVCVVRGEEEGVLMSGRVERGFGRGGAEAHITEFTLTVPLL